MDQASGREDSNRSVVKVSLMLEGAKVPTRTTAGAGGYHLYSVESCFIHATEQVVVSTGVAFALPDDIAGLIFSRSGLARREDIEVFCGVLDSDFRGELKVMLRNKGNVTRKIEKGQRIAQLLLVPVTTPDIIVVQHLTKTDRGSKGFGSTGK